MKNELKIKALEIIEAIVSCDSKRISQKQRDAIYRYAHCALGRCKNPHIDWITKLNKEYIAYKKAKII